MPPFSCKRQFFASPVFGDADKTRTAKTLNTILMTGMLLLIFLGGIAVPFLFAEKLYNTAFILVLFLMLAVTRWLMQCGQVQFASTLFVSTTWTISTIFLFLAGDMASIAFVFYVSATVVAGLLLGTRVALLHAGACSLTGLATVVLEASGYALPRLFPVPAIAGWVGLTASLLLVVTALTLALRGLNDALALARQRLEEFERAEQEKKHLQERLTQAQKMEAVGRLTGGVAHDFSNLLTAIQGYSKFALDELAPDDPVRADVREVQRAAGRAETLTNQLLSFSRKQVLQPRVLKLDDLLNDMENLLRRLIGEDIDLSTVLAPDLGYVRADPGQIEQVIMNLFVNARDAMPQGGKLTFEAANVELDETYARTHLGINPGQYVMLAVSDNGAGMSDEVMAHLFEPFFTTKEQGCGTGLGLSTVYGIVKRANGHIEAESQPGEGSTFRIYLPRSDAEAVASAPLPRSGTLARGTETVLLVEDEDMVREVAHRALERQGYTVLTARLPEQALNLMQHYVGPVSLLITDVVMPGMNGPELTKRLLEFRPGLRVMYVSGYTDDELSHHGVLEPGVVLLLKPFDSNTFVQAVREVLDVGVSR